MFLLALTPGPSTPEPKSYSEKQRDGQGWGEDEA